MYAILSEYATKLLLKIHLKQDHDIKIALDWKT